MNNRIKTCEKRSTYFKKSITYQNPSTIPLKSEDYILTNLDRMFDILNRIKRKLLLCHEWLLTLTG
jgi:hypothetical protein